MNRNRTLLYNIVVLLLQQVFLLLISKSSTNVFVVHGAQSRRRIVVRRNNNSNDYDRSITTFSKDGRLAQVEYGMEASLRGSSVAVANLNDNNNNNNNNGICMVIQNSSFGKLHRLDHHLWLVTSGLSGDARFLASHLRKHCQNHRLAYGEAPTTKQIAKVAGEVQHELTRTAGARPLGCTAIVVGMDQHQTHTSSSSTTSSSSSNEGTTTILTPRIFQTDPGGIVEECLYCAAGNERTKVEKVLAPFAKQQKLQPNNNNKMENKNKNNKLIKNKKFFTKSKVTAERDDALTGQAAAMTEKVLRQFGSDTNNNNNNNSVDVWILRPNPKCRGGIQATCYRNIQKQTMGLIN